jgi:DNA-binding LacI/PurR family transcriptional regulator
MSAYDKQSGQAGRGKSIKSDGGPTMEDLAELAGVSKITVSRALRGSPLVTPETREKIQQLADQQGYRLNLSARNLRTGRSHSVAVLVEMTPAPDRPMSGPYPLELLGGITQELTAAGYSVVLTSKQLLHTAPVMGADGLILLGQGAQGEAVREVKNMRLPLVVWGAPDQGANVVVGSDNRAGGASAAEHFLQLGRRRCVFLGDLDHAEIRQRHEGFVASLGEAGAGVLTVKPTAFTYEAGFAAVEGLRAQGQLGFDALFAASDLLAMGAIRALIQHGVTVPGDVSVVGYDDAPEAATFVPPLTSVHQDLRLGGMLLAQKMLALLKGEPVESEMLANRLVVRAS